MALLSTLAASHTAQLRHQDVAVAAALTSGYRLAFAVGAGLSAAALHRGRHCPSDPASQPGPGPSRPR